MDYGLSLSVHKELLQIQEASNGLLFLSESDHPFEMVELKSNDIEKEVRQLALKPADSVIEKQTVDYFFRNMVKTYQGYSQEQLATAQKFLKLQELVKQKLKDAQVYRIGTIQVDAFIIGQLHDGTIGGLRTKLIET